MQNHFNKVYVGDIWYHSGREDLVVLILAIKEPEAHFVHIGKDQFGLYNSIWRSDFTWSFGCWRLLARLDNAT